MARAGSSSTLVNRAGRMKGLLALTARSRASGGSRRVQSAVVLAVGGRGRAVGGGVVYKVCKAAARYGASVVQETTNSAKAYAQVRANLPRSRFVKYHRGWLAKN